MAESRQRNGVLKTKERVRRDQRMAGIIKGAGQLPYPPAVMSWLSAKLDKPSRLITQDEVTRLLSEA
jgi:hypothetical protein